MKETAKIGVIGGSGLYEMEGITGIEERSVRTPYGRPSDKIVLGTIGGKRVAFLPRHGKGHRLLPAEVNYRANIWALKSLGVEWVISVSATGSLKLKIRPRDFVIPDQLFDRTRQRPNTFFGDGIVVHISFDEPFSPQLRGILHTACKRHKIRVHNGGTYVCIEGPSFSTKAESKLFRSWGMDVIGMTNLPEARLAREAELSYATVALATDYDVWKEGEEVSVERVIANLQANVENAKKVLKTAIELIPIEKARDCPAASALAGAVMTSPDLWPKQKLAQVELFLKKYYPEVFAKKRSARRK